MVIKDNTVETENQGVTKGATDARRNVTKIQLIEFKMRISKCVEEKDEMMFAVNEMGFERLEWFINLEEKP